MLFSPRSQCHGKRRYARRRDAKKAMRQAQTAGRYGSGMIVYKCAIAAVVITLATTSNGVYVGRANGGSDDAKGGRRQTRSSQQN